MIATTASAATRTCRTIRWTAPFQPTDGKLGMSKTERLRQNYEANIACGDISGPAEARMLAEIAVAEAEGKRLTKSLRHCSGAQ